MVITVRALGEEEEAMPNLFSNSKTDVVSEEDMREIIRRREYTTV